MQKYEQVSSNWTKYRAATFSYIFAHGVFSDSKGGRRMRGAGLLVCSETIPPSCGNSLIGLKLWAVPPGEPGPANGRENRTWTQAWPLYLFLCGLARAGTVSQLREGPGPRSQPAASRLFLIFIPLSNCSLLDVLAHTPKAVYAHSFHTGPSCSKPWYFRRLVTLNSINDTGSLGYLALASPLRSVAPVKMGPDPTTQG